MIFFKIFKWNANIISNDWFQALATPREILLNKVPFPLPTPEILNLDKIQALTTDTIVSENGKFLNSITRSAFLVPRYYRTVSYVACPTFFVWWNLQLWLSMILELFLISLRDTLLSFLSHIGKEAHNLVLQSVKESLQMLGHKILWIFWSWIIFLSCLYFHHFISLFKEDLKGFCIFLS